MNNKHDRPLLKKILLLAMCACVMLPVLWRLLWPVPNESTRAVAPQAITRDGLMIGVRTVNPLPFDPRSLQQPIAVKQASAARRILLAEPARWLRVSELALINILTLGQNHRIRESLSYLSQAPGFLLSPGDSARAGRAIHAALRWPVLWLALVLSVLSLLSDRLRRTPLYFISFGMVILHIIPWPPGWFFYDIALCLLLLSLWLFTACHFDKPLLSPHAFMTRK